MKPSVKYILVAGLVAALALSYWRAAIEHSKTVNTRYRGFGDQGAYMRDAQNMRLTNYTFVSGRNRMPGYPFIQSLFYRPDLSDDAFFEQGKRVNIILSLVLLACLGLIFFKSFPSLTAGALLLITAFTVFLFKAAYFQSELLFYFLSFAALLLMSRMLVNPTWKLALSTGVLAGAAHLTKGSALPGLVIFLTVFAVQGAYALGKRGSREPRPAVTHRLRIDFARPALARLLSLALVGLAFVGTIYPYISTSKRVFGHYLYNVNTTFYIWYDSWEEAELGTRAHRDQLGWPDMPPDEIPSLGKYVREHTAGQIAGRFLKGSGTLAVMHCTPIAGYGYCKYTVITFVFACLAIALNRPLARSLAGQYRFLLVFWLSYFWGYVVLYAWYVAAIPGPRFALALFLPSMFVLAKVITTITESGGRPLTLLGKQLSLTAALNGLILPLLAVDIYFILTARILAMAGAY